MFAFVVLDLVFHC